MDKRVPSKSKRHCVEQTKVEQFLENSDSEEELFADSDSEFELFLEENSDDEDSEDRFEDSDSEEPICVQAGNNAAASSQEKKITWSEEPHFNVITFSGENKLRQNIVDDQPYNFFQLVITDEFLEHIVRETNSYTENVSWKGKTNKNDCPKYCRPLILCEFKIFLGLWFHMGHIEIKRISDYWRTDDLYNVSCFPKYMSRNRFCFIMKCLHFSQNPQRGDANFGDRINKIRFVQDYLNNRMDEIYYPNKNLCVDESMVLWRGRLSFRQYIANKKHKFGVKLYILTEPNGLALKVRLYTGADGDLSGKGHTSNVVLTLTHNYLKKGHSLYMDNFYNSYSLSKHLLEKSTYVTGTLRKRRKENPKEIINAKIKKGETVTRYCNGIAIGKWKDKREVLVISTEFDNTMITVENKRGKEIQKPKAIINYNKNMSGIDRLDQMLAYYCSERKTIKWYKKLAIHFLSIMMLNSFHLYNKYSTGRKLSYYDFRHIIIRKLLYEENLQATNEDEPSDIYEHIPQKYEKDTNGRQMRKRCRECYTKKMRKDTPYFCPVCPGGPGLCLEKCFQAYHTNKK